MLEDRSNVARWNVVGATNRVEKDIEEDAKHWDGQIARSVKGAPSFGNVARLRQLRQRKRQF